ncbi:hypothetical protein MED121_00535 [Marinomonas sp. MED121]|uniref:hypothetical protein n=1 Tax=Marinomonas sp. MED121 TaxID=314277 RepID=UPI0000690594|nr:hypothetical protein [Marinomonas sp. MED121]EAQ63649.1 hypothetical protein MED121_00535 [Marinomonas sp. MED121]
MYKIILSGFILFISMASHAHIGAHSSDVAIKVLSADLVQNHANIALTFTNEGQDTIYIEAITSNVGEVVFALNYPIAIDAQSQFNFTDSLALLVSGNEEIPHIFTLIFNLGEAGDGPVTIIASSFME